MFTKSSPLSTLERLEEWSNTECVELGIQSLKTLGKRGISWIIVLRSYESSENATPISPEISEKFKRLRDSIK